MNVHIVLCLSKKCCGTHQNSCFCESHTTTEIVCDSFNAHMLPICSVLCVCCTEEMCKINAY